MARKHKRSYQRRKTRKERPTVEGVLRIERPGRARVQTPEGTFDVARRGQREAMNGDEVQVRLIPMHGRGREPVAYVQTVMRRACTSYLGTYDVVDPLGVVRPLDARVGHDFFVLPEDKSTATHDVRPGDVVRARIVEYPTRSSAGIVTIEERVGSADGLDLGIETIIASHGLATEFPASALEEARRVVACVAEELERDPLRRDLRDVCCVTIDPVDARDFDDAVGARATENGFELDVHIADVTSYLPVGSSMDLEARRRTCSTYLVDRVLPMLPEELSNDVCSLRPEEDRLTMTVRMRLDAGAEVVGAEAFCSAIQSNARLTYDEVDDWLEGRCDASWSREVGETLRLLDRIARFRREVRRRRGSVDFNTVESKVLLDAQGVPTSIVRRERTRATSLVEEAMLLANECVARMLADRDIETAYRVHERPAPEDLKACVPVLAELGLLRDVGAERVIAADPSALQQVLEAARGTSGEVLANSVLLRAQKRALYMPHNDGHYALGASAYCHFTSPIRRYPDVMVHRALKRHLLGKAPDSSLGAELPHICRACSDQERVAEVASRESNNLKMAQYYERRVGERYSGVVVGCERFGLFVMLDETGAEGLLPTRALGEEWFVHDAERMSLTGESTGRTWHLGKRVAVQVTDCDVAAGRINFGLA